MRDQEPAVPGTEQRHSAIELCLLQQEVDKQPEMEEDTKGY